MSLGTAIPAGGLRKSDRPHVATLVKFLSAGCAGILLGLVVTFAVVEHGKGFGAVEAGPWIGWPNGFSEIDPYTRAILAYSGEMTLSDSAGMSFIAYGDSKGREFDPACDYIMTGEIPSARFWTLALFSPAGVPIANPAGRYGFTSSEVLRSNDGSFEITISRHARPGNWLPSGEASKFVLVLRFYDSELSAGANALGEANMPTLMKARCE